MSKRGVRLMNVGIIEVVIEIVKVYYEDGACSRTCIRSNLASLSVYLSGRQ